MLFSNIAIVDESFEVQTGQWVGIEDGRIGYLDAAAPQEEEAARFGERYDGAGKLLVPGMYNAHAHASMTLLRGYAENAPLQVWLNDLVWPFEAKMTPEDNYWATLLACAEMARYGTVSFSDMYYHTDERAQAITESGMKANLCESMLYFEAKPFSEYPISAKYDDLVRRYHGAVDGRLRIDHNIHAEYTSNPITCADIAADAKEKGVSLHIHLSETKSEHEECKERHGGMTPTRYFESIGVFDVPVIAAHCVWLEEDDIRIMAEHGASAALCPASNMKLGSGYAPVGSLLNSKVNVALGTDGMASNNNHDMYQDLYLLSTIYKGNSLDPTLVSPAQALRAATLGGARAQGREDCGLIAKGYRADLAVLDITGLSWCPMTNALSNLAFAGHGSDVCLTMVDGQVVYRDGVWPTIDVERAKAEVAARTKRIRSEL